MSENNDIAVAAEEAVKAEEEAKAEQNVGSYTHTFAKPFDYHGFHLESLTFQWDSLTGADHMEIEDEMLARGKTLITPEFSGDFLWGMACRACTLKDENGVRVLRGDAPRHLTMRDMQIICKKARSFLLKSGS